MDDLTKKKIENAKQILANGNCSAIECRFCLACPSEITGYCIAENKRRVPIDGLSDAGIEFFKSKIAEYEGGKMKYKVGEMVKVKEGLITFNSYGGIKLNTEMSFFRGDVKKITHEDNDRYKLEGCDFIWSKEMLEPTWTAPYGEYMDNVNKKQQYHIGEKVRILNNNEIFTITSRTFSETGDVLYCVKNGKVSVYVSESEIIPTAVFKPYYNKKTVYVEGMHFEMMVDHEVSTKKHETRKEIRKRLLKL